MAVTSSATMSASLYKQYWLPGFLTELRSNLVYKPLGLPGKVPEGEGQIVHWLALADMSLNTTAATEGTDPTSYALSGGDIQATLTPYNESVTMSRHLARTWIAGSMDEVLNKLARNAANKIDRVIRDSILTAGGMAVYGGTAVARNSIDGSSTFALSVAKVRSARNKIERANVAPHTDGFYVGVVHPDVSYDLEGDTNWRDVVKYDTRTFKNILAGEIGEIHKVRFIKTTENLLMTGSGSSSTVNVWQTYVLGREAFGVSDFEDVDIIVKNPAPASSVNGYATAGYYLAFATKALQNSALARVETWSTFA